MEYDGRTMGTFFFGPKRDVNVGFNEFAPVTWGIFASWTLVVIHNVFLVGVW